jgi:hypothetical protein
VAVRCWRDVQHTEQLSDQLDAIFFAASGAKSFASAEVRASFRERWRYVQRSTGLGTTLTHHVVLD